MCAKRVAVICSTDPRQDNRILKQVQVLMDLNYQVTLFGVDSGVDVPTYSPNGASVHLYPKDIFPSWIRRGIRFFRGLKRSRSTEKIAAPITDLRYVKRGEDQLTVFQAVKAIGVDMRYLSYLYGAVCRDVTYFNPDIIHAHELPAAVAGAKLAKQLNCKFIYDAHEFEADREAKLPDFSWTHRKRTERKVMRRAHDVITVSDMMAETHSKRYGVSKPTVIYNAPLGTSVASNEKNESDVRKLLGLGEAQKLAVYIGGMRPGRGLDIIVRAVSLVPDLHLACVGISPNSTASKQLIELWPKETSNARLHFVRPQQPSHLISFLSSADISVIATQDSCLNHTYSMPNKLFESAFADLPLAVTPIAATSKFVQDLGVGESSKSYEIADYAAALREVLNKPRATYYSVDTKRRLQANYSWRAQAKKIADIYRNI